SISSSEAARPRESSTDRGSRKVGRREHQKKPHRRDRDNFVGIGAAASLCQGVRGFTRRPKIYHTALLSRFTTSKNQVCRLPRKRSGRADRLVSLVCLTHARSPAFVCSVSDCWQCVTKLDSIAAYSDRQAVAGPGKYPSRT